jgi:hypothetical protein
MWFVQQFDSFLNLGICKEYPKMARPKSTSGGKSSRSNPNKEQPGISSPANIPDMKTAAAATAPEPKSVEPRKLEMVKTEPREKVVPINRAPINLPSTAEREVLQRYQKQQSA